MKPVELKEWSDMMRSLGIAHVRTPQGLELTLTPDAFFSPIEEEASGVDFSEPRKQEHGPLGSRFLRAPRLPRYRDKG